MIKTKDRKIILEFKDKLSKDVLIHLRKIIVFGSRARGEEQKDSDLDVAILVDRKKYSLEKKMEDSAYQVMWDHDFKPIISLKIFTEKQFNKALKQGFSFYKHVSNDGICL